MSAGAADADRQRTHARAELDYGDETVATRSVVALSSRITLGAEGGERAPLTRGERHGGARFRIVVVLHDGAIVALKAVDLAPRHLPAAEILRQSIRRLRERGELLRGRRAIGHVVPSRHSRCFCGLRGSGPEGLAEEHGQRGRFRIQRPAIVPAAQQTYRSCELRPRWIVLWQVIV